MHIGNHITPLGLLFPIVWMGTRKEIPTGAEANNQTELNGKLSVPINRETGPQPHSQKDRYPLALEQPFVKKGMSAEK